MSKFESGLTQNLVVASRNSKFLLIQLYEEAKRIGWVDEPNGYNERFHPNASKITYVIKFIPNGNILQFHNHDCTESGGIDYNLPEDWNTVIELISKVKEKEQEEKKEEKTVSNPKVDDWVWHKNNRYAYKIKSLEGRKFTAYFGPYCDNGYLDLYYCRPATKEEIEGTILKEGMKRFPKGTKYIPAHLDSSICTVGDPKSFRFMEGTFNLIESMSDYTKNGHTMIELLYYDKENRWAKPVVIEQKPDKTVKIADKTVKITKNNTSDCVLCEKPSGNYMIMIARGLAETGMVDRQFVLNSEYDWKIKGNILTPYKK